MASKTIPADDGIFIPRELLPAGGEWIATITPTQVVLRPKLSAAESLRRMDELSERLRQKYGEFPDSSVLIRQDRDDR